MRFVEEKVPIRIFHFSVDSRYRDVELYPSLSQYVVNIPTPFKNVVRVELVSAIYEKYGTENYLNVHIDELGGNLESNNNGIVGVFTQLPLIHPLNLYSSDQFRSVRVFERPLAKLGRLSIRFRSPDGEEYPMQDHLMRFEVHCCKDSSWLQSRGAGLDLFSEYANVYLPEKAKDFALPATPMMMPAAPPAGGASSVSPSSSSFFPGGGGSRSSEVIDPFRGGSVAAVAPTSAHNHHHQQHQRQRRPPPPSINHATSTSAQIRGNGNGSSPVFYK